MSAAYPIDLSPSYDAPVFGVARALVVINGQIYVPTAFEIEINNYSASDTATVTLPIFAQNQSNAPSDFSLSAIDFGAATQTGKPYPIAIYAGFPQNPNSYGINDLVLQFAGIVDQFDWESYIKDELTINCRSYAALLLNTKTTAAWNNCTTAYVAQYLAKKHGLTPQVSVANPAMMQDVYNRDFITGTQNLDEWSLLQAMAEVDNAELFVRGTTLYYRTRPPDGSMPSHTLEWENNLVDCSVLHSPQFSELVRVNVKTSSPLVRTGTHVTIQGVVGATPTPGTQRTTTATTTYDPIFGARLVTSTRTSTLTTNGVPGTTTTATAATNASGGNFASGNTTMPNGPSALEYVFHFPGLTEAQADARAQDLWVRISSHLFQLTAHCAVTPGVQSLLNQDTIWNLQGPIPSHNLKYYGRKVSQSWSVDQNEDGDGESEGWSFAVEGVNVPIVEQTL